MTQPALVPIRALEHHRYCPRQAALIHIDGVWHDNEHTVRGRREHTRVDHAPARAERGQLVLRHIPLWSESLGLTGRADAVHIHPDGRIEPVEYKAGRRHGDAAEVQVCAQALCLEEMTASPIPVASVWYAGHRRRSLIELSDPLRSTTLDAIRSIRELFETADLPAPADDPRCDECQLAGHCLPNVVADPEGVWRYMAEELGCYS